MHLSLDETDLQPLIETIVDAAVTRLAGEQRTLGDKLAFSEAEAAALLSVRPHVLRDARLRGELKGSRVGKSIRYERDELLRFLRRRRNV